MYSGGILMSLGYSNLITSCHGCPGSPTRVFNSSRSSLARTRVVRHKVSHTSSPSDGRKRSVSRLYSDPLTQSSSILVARDQPIGGAIETISPSLISQLFSSLRVDITFLLMPSSNQVSWSCDCHLSASNRARHPTQGGRERGNALSAWYREQYYEG